MRAIPTLKISISGVRGVVGDSLTPTLLTRFAQAFGTYVGSSAIVIGRDTRTSGEMVRQAVLAGLVVERLPRGRPRHLSCSDSCNGWSGISGHKAASPSPPATIRQNGTPSSLSVQTDCFSGPGQAGDLLDIYHQGEYTVVRGSEMREVESYSGAVDLHTKAILDALGPLPSQRRKLRVVIDCCNGAGSVMGPRLLRELGAEVVPINDIPDGLFPRPAEPLPENLGALCEAVRNHGADIGFAQDMDADRLAVVSEKGLPIGEEFTLVLATRYVLDQQPGPVVANLSTTDALEYVAREFNCPVFRTKIGEANVTEGMKKEKAVIGGEGNGGVIYPRINFARDSLVGMALILHLLSKTGRPVSALMGELPPFQMVKEKLECPSDKIRALLKTLRSQYAKHPIDVRDGIKVRLERGWFHIRGSNTEPIIRLVAEAESTEALNEIRATVFQQVRNILSVA